MEALLICHAGEQESVDGHSLLCILLSLQREQLLLTAGLLEAVVHWIQREKDEGDEGDAGRGGEEKRGREDREGVGKIEGSQKEARNRKGE